MKLQHALPVLSAAASFMVLGLAMSDADAQEPTERPQVRVRPGNSPTIRPRIASDYRLYPGRVPYFCRA